MLHALGAGLRPAAIVGRRNAELCQAHAFGISLDEWLSIEQEG
jgi:hypothetical protein